MKGDYCNSKTKIPLIKKYNPLFKIVTVGDSEVGKTTFLSSIVVKFNLISYDRISQSI
jgi:GTPase SAR1 family protein